LDDFFGAQLIYSKLIYTLQLNCQCLSMSHKSTLPQRNINLLEHVETLNNLKIFFTVQKLELSKWDLYLHPPSQAYRTMWKMSINSLDIKNLNENNRCTSSIHMKDIPKVLIKYVHWYLRYSLNNLCLLTNKGTYKVNAVYPLTLVWAV
jgi:hypothetical protein